MRSALALILLTVSLSSAQAVEISDEHAAPCSDVATLKRMDTIARAGDRAGLEAYIKETMASGECRRLAVGTKVRIERSEGRYTCVAPFGSTAPCRWVYVRELKP